MIFLVTNVLHFMKNIWQKNLLSQISCFLGICFLKITKIFHNCLQHERMFLYLYFEYWQMGKPILGGTTKNHLPKTLDLIQLIF
jgi:hypothetical protein